jgi:hypothetical protein
MRYSQTIILWSKNMDAQKFCFLWLYACVAIGIPIIAYSGIWPVIFLEPVTLVGLYSIWNDEW